MRNYLAIAFAAAVGFAPLGASAEDAPAKSERAMPDGPAKDRVDTKEKSERVMPDQAKEGSAPSGKSERAMPAK